MNFLNLRMCRIFFKGKKKFFGLFYLIIVLGKYVYEIKEKFCIFCFFVILIWKKFLKIIGKGYVDIICD